MPPKRTVLSRPTRQERAQQRRAVGRLSERQVAERTRQRYDAALRWFFAWMRSWQIAFPTDAFDLDDILCQCVDQAWEEGEGYSLVGDLLSAVGTYIPRLRNQLPAAWRLFGAWRKLELPCRAWPLTTKQVHAVAYALLLTDCWDVALVVLLAFHGVLRTHEAVSVTVAQFVWSTSEMRGHLALPDTKGTKRSGAIEGVALEAPALVALLICACAKLAPGDSLMRRPPSAFRACFAKAVSSCQLEGFFKPYSCRRGGATAAFRANGSLDAVADRGRWGDIRTARIYINTALADLQAQAQPPQVNHKIEEFSTALRTVTQHWLSTKWGISGSTWTLT